MAKQVGDGRLGGIYIYKRLAGEAEGLATASRICFPEKGKLLARVGRKVTGPDSPGAAGLPKEVESVHARYFVCRTVNKY